MTTITSSSVTSAVGPHVTLAMSKRDDGDYVLHDLVVAMYSEAPADLRLRLAAAAIQRAAAAAPARSPEWCSRHWPQIDAALADLRPRIGSSEDPHVVKREAQNLAESA